MDTRVAKRYKKIYYCRPVHLLHYISLYYNITSHSDSAGLSFFSRQKNKILVNTDLKTMFILAFTYQYISNTEYRCNLIVQ